MEVQKIQMEWLDSDGKVIEAAYVAFCLEDGLFARNASTFIRRMLWLVSNIVTQWALKMVLGRSSIACAGTTTNANTANANKGQHTLEQLLSMFEKDDKEEREG